MTARMHTAKETQIRLMVFIFLLLIIEFCDYLLWRTFNGSLESPSLDIAGIMGLRDQAWRKENLTGISGSPRATRQFAWTATRKLVLCRVLLGALQKSRLRRAKRMGRCRNISITLIALFAVLCSELLYNVVHHHAAFHYDLYVLQDADVDKWIAIDGNEVGEFPRFDRAYAILPA